MSDDHFSRETLERFLRSELGHGETLRLVRHLLRQCPLCTPLLREVSQSRNFRLLLLQGGIVEMPAPQVRDDRGKAPEKGREEEPEGEEDEERPALALVGGSPARRA